MQYYTKMSQVGYKVWSEMVGKLYKPLKERSMSYFPKNKYPIPYISLTLEHFCLPAQTKF